MKMVFPANEWVCNGGMWKGKYNWDIEGEMRLKPNLHIHTSDKSNSEMNDERLDYIIASWCTVSLASSFVALALKAVFLTWVKRPANVYTNQKWFGSHTSKKMWMFVRVWKQFIRLATATCECSCKFRGELQTRICKRGIISNNSIIEWCTTCV